MDALEELFIRSVRQSPTFKSLADDIARSSRPRRIALKGLRASSFGAAAAALAIQSDQSRTPEKASPYSLILVVTANDEHSGEIFDDLSFFGVNPIFHYPKWQSLPYDEDGPMLEEQVKHLEFLHFMSEGGSGSPLGGCAVCSASMEALFSRVAPLSFLNELKMKIRWGERLDTLEFVWRAIELGYERTPTVEGRGEFAVRGGIIDIFPLDAENPIRIDLFGDEIEAIRWFDVHTQRSLKQQETVECVTILPAREGVLVEQALGSGYGTAEQPLPTLLDLLPANCLLLLDHPEMYGTLDERFRQVAERQYHEHSREREGLSEPAVLYADLRQIESAAARLPQLHHSLILEGPQSHGYTFHTNSFETVKPSLEHYVTQIRKRLADDFTVAIVCDNEGQAQRMDEMLRENVVGSVVWNKGGGPAGNPSLRSAAPFEGFRDVIITTGSLHSGFVFPEAQLYVVTDREIFGRYKRRHVYRKIYKGAPIADAREIRHGDYVVHVDHGIGKFVGIRTQSVDNRITDFIELLYAGDDKLLVPVDKIGYVQKFSGAEQAAPALDKLGSKKWSQRRKKSQEDIERLAKEMLSLYARRELSKGFPYHEDTLWQREFEASFLYTETPDQLRAIQEVKTDMGSERPMDRLVCGDVGYGKTEVAIRAAFKAIQENRQVALLCPTTILAQQHCNTFRERFADYPIRVEMLSRFKTPAEVRAIQTAIRAGEVQMIVGTHMLLGKSIQFRDLGLVIVDEEQRFGVSHKEKLKELRTSVDFLTLTATPIPRTLYMALSGLRDMSVINTPPADRHPIRTRVIHWSREEIEEAILRELNRGGQVFFVHNRVQNIHQIADKVKEIVPGARIAIAHGQMNEHELEQVMLDFIDQKYDILVSTTIIESGLDIPNVNTIIINRADTFGLAQLYQLRGRVGREHRRAFAYLIVPAGQAITEQAIARLAAIEEFTELGVGFNIAMRDMEIRGTGNLLGKEQHGTMNAIGFDLYCRMLEEAVQELRGEYPEDEAEVEIQWKASAYLPSEFIPVESQRVTLYRRLAEAATLAELDDVHAEIVDRYGEVRRGTTNQSVAGSASGSAAVIEDLPEPVENLFHIAKMRILGRKLGLQKIAVTQAGFKFMRKRALEVLGPNARVFVRDSNPKVYTDDPDALEFFYSDWTSRRQLLEALTVLSKL